MAISTPPPGQSTPGINEELRQVRLVGCRRLCVPMQKNEIDKVEEPFGEILER
jgi:hypothetical protein